jgi:hypothetical protein
MQENGVNFEGQDNEPPDREKPNQEVAARVHRPGHSWETNLVEFMDFVTKAVDDGKSVNIFYSDFAKAFDKILKKRLIKRMKAKGLEP